MKITEKLNRMDFKKAVSPIIKEILEEHNIYSEALELDLLRNLVQHIYRERHACADVAHRFIYTGKNQNYKIVTRQVANAIRDRENDF